MDLSRQGIADAQPPFSLSPTREELCLPIKRYGRVMHTTEIVEYPGGDYVKHADHIAEVVQLRQELHETTATADRLRDELNEVWKVLPADCAYMDPPDGGDVPLIEQLRRMAEDAWKYRQLNA